MKDQERHPPQAERVQDLEVKEDEAREIAGGKQANPIKWGAKKAGKSSAGIRHGKNAT
jgi:hypothetical protein